MKTSRQKKFNVDRNELLNILNEILQIPSPSGYTDQIVQHVGEKLNQWDIYFELTRRGAIRARLRGERKNPTRAIIAHLDTLGAMVKNLKPNGRLEVTPIGTWSSRFAEGARVTIFTDVGPKRGTILPMKSSGHTYNEEVDSMPVAWENVELRVDEHVETYQDLWDHGFRIGDFISIDTDPEYTQSGYLNSRHLDNKAGVACLLAAAKTVIDSGRIPSVESYMLFTISEEVGSGASAVLHGDVSEMVSIDNSTVAPGQNSLERGITICMKDSSGPFDYHLTHKLIDLCEDHHLPYARDIFKFYRCDAASALEAGNDIRTALVCFGCDSSHGYERTHIDSLVALTELLCHYLVSPPTSSRDAQELAGLENFPIQPHVQPVEAEIQNTLKPSEYQNEPISSKKKISASRNWPGGNKRIGRAKKKTSDTKRSGSGVRKVRRKK